MLQRKFIVSLFMWAMSGLFCQTKAYIYQNYSSSWNYTTFVTLLYGGGGGGGVTVTINNDILTVNFSGGFSPAYMKTGCIVPLATTPALPNISLGDITTKYQNVATGWYPYNARIEGGQLCISSQISPIIDWMGTSFTVDLATLQASGTNTIYSYISETTLYGYNNYLPIASVSKASLEQVAYTSFESTQETETWAYAPAQIQTDFVHKGRTGEKYFVFGNNTTIVRSNLPVGKYLLSYWVKNISPTSTSISVVGGTFSEGRSEATPINGWYYCEKYISLTQIGSVHLTGSQNGWVDEVRLHPEKALMVTQTYDAQKGVTSKTNAVNQSEYYEYDGFGRMIYTRDEKRNIIKENVYYLKPQN